MVGKTREEVRGAIFARKQFKRVKATLWGVEVEFQQPSLGKIFNQNLTEADNSLILQLIIDQSYVPGTQEKVFTSADLETLKAMPFDQELNKLSEAISELTGNAGDAEKN